MAQDYAGGLQRSPRPNRIPRDGDRPNADMVERERAARQNDAAEFRFGRYIDSGGNWATAWQAPPLGQAIGPTPAFVAPGRVVKFRTGEMALQSAPSDDPDQPTESVLITPGQWVVRYDGDEEAAIVVNDQTFRGEMTSEAERAQLEAEKNSVQEPAIASETPVGSYGAAEPQNAPTGTPEAPASVVHLMVDHFMKLVMSDNNRLRFELSEAERQVTDWRRQTASALEQRDRLERELSEARKQIARWHDPEQAMREDSAKLAEVHAQWRREDDERNRPVPEAPAYNPPDPDPVDVPPELNPDPVEAGLAESPPRVMASKRKAN